MHYRALMEKHLGRKLNGRKEHVHHIDGNHKNNALSNLMVLSNRDHRRIHCNWQFVEGELHKFCSECGNRMEDNPKAIACYDCRYKRRQQRTRFYLSLDNSIVERIGHDNITHALRKTLDNLINEK